MLKKDCIILTMHIFQIPNFTICSKLKKYINLNDGVIVAIINSMIDTQITELNTNYL